jgi:crotonobetainyl-CoA:carnitine CoA-transferase CaiB-like acyl-CoA transferase
MSLTGEPDAPPSRFGLSLVDFITGTMLATATLAAIIDAQQHGTGRDFDISLLDAALHQTSYPAFWYLNAGHITERAPRSAHPFVTPSQSFPTADGWIFVMAQLPKFWQRLCEVLDRLDLTDDQRFSTTDARLANREALTRELDAVFAQQTTAYWLDRLGGKVPVAPVRDLPGALSGPIAEAMLETIPHPERQEGMTVLTNPIMLDGQRLPNRHAPALGADTDSILSEIGYSGSEIDELRGSGAI